MAPMMAYTDTYLRSLLEIINPQILLYTEMIQAGRIMRSDDWRDFLRGEGRQNNVVIQLGGGDPEVLASAAERVAEAGLFREINLNVGCPSPRVQAGMFGACLFKNPDLVANMVARMRESSGMAVTVKTRIGVDDHDSYQHLYDFVDVVRSSGCYRIIIHARKAWLKGLNPAQNRSVPPLDYQRVANLVADFPDMVFGINGGITYDLVQQGDYANYAEIMLGRQVTADPLGLALDGWRESWDSLGEFRAGVALRYITYLESIGSDLSTSRVMPLVMLAKGFVGARQQRAKILDLVRGGGDCRLLREIVVGWGL